MQLYDMSLCQAQHSLLQYRYLQGSLCIPPVCPPRLPESSDFLLHCHWGCQLCVMGSLPESIGNIRCRMYFSH